MKSRFLIVACLLSACVSSVFAQGPADGTYYLYDTQSEGFLSRGADWGTRVTVDHLGIPVTVSTQGSYRYMKPLDNSSKYIANASGSPYTDISSSTQGRWVFESDGDGGYTLKNTAANKWLSAGVDLGFGANLSSQTDATVFKFITTEEYETMVAEYGKRPAGQFTEIDATEMLQNASMKKDMSGWTMDFQGVINHSLDINEAYEGYGKMSQVVTGLPKGWYRFEIQGFYRDGFNAACVGYATAGHHMSNVYIYANDDVARLADWASDRAGANNPNSMKEAAALFAAGKYKNSVYTFVGEDGMLEVGLVQPGKVEGGWLIWGESSLTYLSQGDGSLALYKALLDKAVAQLQQVIDARPVLHTPEAASLLADAQALIAKAATVKTVEEMQKLVSDIEIKCKECKAFLLNIERNDMCNAYLFVYFPSNDNENLYYAMSTDGYNYTPLNNGHRVMSSDSVALKKGIRDPHILRGEDGKTFYMVATDMKCSEGWASNRGMVLYKSTDLIHWQHSTVHFPTRFPEWAGVTRVWAPETIWDPNYDNGDGTKGRYMIYYSLLTNDGKCTYDKVFYSYANDDFTDLLTDPVYLYDRGSATIDADIVYDERDMLYHMIYKNEGSGGICQVTAQTLTAPEGMEGSQWSEPSGTLQQTNVAVEGGGLFRLIDSNNWVMMYDCYGSGYYQFCETSDWEHFTLKAQTTTSGAFTPRHGTVIPLHHQETRAVLDAFPTDGFDIDCTLPTTIEKPEAETRSHASGIYTLDGRKLNGHPSRPGVYIVDGKKQVVTSAF